APSSRLFSGARVGDHRSQPRRSRQRQGERTGQAVYFTLCRHRRVFLFPRSLVPLLPNQLPYLFLCPLSLVPCPLPFVPSFPSANGNRACPIQKRLLSRVSGPGRRRASRAWAWCHGPTKR